MDTDIHIEAIRRYAALTGQCEDMTRAEHLQAIVDRYDYGNEYCPKGPCGFDKAGLLVRFMHEVCSIPLWRARECVVIVIQSDSAYSMEMGPSELATELACDVGNILVAEAIASLYVAASQGTAWEHLWQNVLETLRYGDRADIEDDSDRSEGETLH